MGSHVIRLLLWATRDEELGLLERVAASGLRPSELASMDLRIPLSTANTLWEFVAAATGRATLGFEVAQTSNFAATLIPVSIFQNSANLREAHANWSRFRRLLNEGLRDEMVVEGPRVWFRVCETPGARLARVWSEFLLTRALRLVRECMSRPGLDALEVQLARPGPLDPEIRALVEDYFGGPVRAGAPCDAFAMPRDVLDTPFINTSPHILAALQARAECLVAELPWSPEGDSLVPRVRQILASAMLGGDVSLGATASSLGTSPRTLQRQLKRFGRSHQALLDEVREAMARDHLGRPGVSVVETAFLLGYSELSGFHRAFRRWTGMTPAGYAATRQRAGSEHRRPR